MSAGLRLQKVPFGNLRLYIKAILHFGTGRKLPKGKSLKRQATVIMQISEINCKHDLTLTY
jgi:hypothetical protein